jgi:hypothetical protein
VISDFSLRKNGTARSGQGRECLGGPRNRGSRNVSGTWSAFSQDRGRTVERFIDLPKLKHGDEGLLVLDVRLAVGNSPTHQQTKRVQPNTQSESPQAGRRPHRSSTQARLAWRRAHPWSFPLASKTCQARELPRCQPVPPAQRSSVSPVGAVASRGCSRPLPSPTHIPRRAASIDPGAL